MKTVAVSLSVLMLCPPPLFAGGCFVRRQVVEVVQPVAVATVFSPLLVVPAYGVAAYPTPAYAQSAAPAYPQAALPAPGVSSSPSCEERAKQLEARLAQLEAQLRPGSPAPTPPLTGTPAVQPANPPAGGAVPPGLALLQAKCSGCHNAANAPTKGANIVLFENGTFKGHPKAASSLYTGRMPKGSTLSDNEVAEAIAYLDSLPK